MLKIFLLSNKLSSPFISRSLVKKTAEAVDGKIFDFIAPGLKLGLWKERTK